MTDCQSTLYERKDLSSTLDPTRRIGKKGSKRRLLVDGCGVPLSIVVTGAKVHDSKGLEPVINAIVVKRKRPRHWRSKHLCTDAGYCGAPCLQAIEKHGYIPHVVDRCKKADIKRRHPGKKARRWVV